MSAAVLDRPLTRRALDALRRAGNPFRNCFVRNPDDDVCARFHVPKLFAAERDQLLGVVDLYRCENAVHSEVLPVLGNKGAGKTHLLYSIKHGAEGAWQLLVTPGVYQKDTDFLEYLLYQVVDTLLGGGRQKGIRPLDFIGDELARRLLASALARLSNADRVDLFPANGLGRLARRIGLGTSSAQGQAKWLMDVLTHRVTPARGPLTTRQGVVEAGIDPARAAELIAEFVEHKEAHNTAGLMRRAILQGFCEAALCGREAVLALFLTHGFAELAFNVRPTRADLVLALFKVLMEIFREVKVPVVVAFDQLEDLLLARRSDDAHKIAESFFAGIVQAIHQLDGLCFLLFAERGLWNRFVPSLDGYIRDRLNNPIHVPRFGSVKAIRLEVPAPELVRHVVEARLRPAWDQLPDAADLPPIFPFTDEQVMRIARTESTLRDMLQQLRFLFDRLVFDVDENAAIEATPPPGPSGDIGTPVDSPFDYPKSEATTSATRIPDPDVSVKSLVVLEAANSADVPPAVADRTGRDVPPATPESMAELWDQELQAACSRLEPEGALTGATRELQAGLGALLHVCHEHGVKVGPWRLQHVVPEWSFSEHPAFGVLSIAHWTCRGGQPWKVGVGLFLARGAGKPKDLEIKLSAMAVEPAVLDHLILLRPDDDLSLTGKSKSHWQDAEKRGHHARLEPIGPDAFAVFSAFPRWLSAVSESLSAGQTLPNLADLIQEKCDRLLEQVCMPVQG